MVERESLTNVTRATLSSMEGRGIVSTSEVDHAVEEALAEQAKKQVHDPRIDKMYKRDVKVIYAFVIGLWVVLWTTFFLAANPFIEDESLRWFLIALGAMASIFNATGMIQNTRRLKHEAVRFYTQDLFWQDQKRELKAEMAAEKARLRARKRAEE